MKRVHIKDVLLYLEKDVCLMGFVDSIRDHGKLVFLDLRDETGKVQCVTSNLERLTKESVIKVVGEVKKRPPSMVNKKEITGAVEVKIKKIEVLSLCERNLPIPIEGDGYDIDESLRLKYRYLDLRRNRLQRNIRLRSDFLRFIREELFKKGFVEIETPLLSKSTPEGARDFLVPSRLYPGNFYALPQSPQQYKQLLMISGFERYFQIARCLRDEDLRKDRGFEFTQVDIEMAYVKREDVMGLVEEVITNSVEKLGLKIVKKPFPIFTFKEAIKKFKSDKFDLRSDLEKKENKLYFSWVIDFPFFEKNKEGNWTFTHNPFSAPLTEKDEELLLKGEKIDSIIASQYDLVCNGFEVAGGSIRANKPEILEAVYKVMGYTKEKIQESIGHMLEAFSFGAPPHGGCALGVERLLMTILGEQYVREVQAFPMSGRGRISVMDAPSKVSKEQLDELGLKLLSRK